MSHLFKTTSMGAVLLAVSAICLSGQETAKRPAANQQSSVLVLRGGRLIDGTGKSPLEKSVVVIDGTRIVQVGQEGAVKIPAGAKVINTAGKTVIPGLIDGHDHLLSDTAVALYLYWGITTVGDMTNQPSWIMQEKRAADKGDTEGAALSPSIFMALGGIDFPPYGARIYKGENLREIKDEASMEAAIVERKQAGANGVKLFTGIPTPLMKYAAEIGHREDLPVFCHCSERTRGRGIDELLDTGIDVIVHTFGVEKATVSPAIKEQIIKGEIPIPEYLMDPSRFDALAQKIIERKMFLNPTLVRDWAKFTKYREQFDRELTMFLEGPVGSAFLTSAGEQQRRNFFEKHKPYKGEHLDQIEVGYRKIGQFYKTFVDKGGKLIASPDAGPNTPGISLHFELQMLQEAGLSPMQILQATTLWPMEAWRRQGEVGTVVAGKRADVVVLNRNPLEDISATRDIQTVIKNGKIVDREALAKWKPRFPNGPYLPAQ